MNLFLLLDTAARRFPEHGAVYAGTTLHQRYAALHDRALRLAAGLARFEPGARIAVVSENAPALLEILFGTWAAGAVVVPINYKLHAREMAQIIEDAGASLVLCSAALAPALAPWLSQGSGPRGLVVIGSPDYEILFQRRLPAATDVQPESLAWLFYTSGTTGRSKGAMLTHRNLMAMTLAHLADMELIDEHCSQIHAAPMSHGSGLYIPAYVARGARQIVPASGGFEPAEFLTLADAHPGCGAFLAPTMVRRLRLAVEATGHRPRHLRCIVYGGGPMYVEELKQALGTFGPVLAQIYGQGETPMTITGLRRQDHLHAEDAVLGSVGTARTGVEVAIVDAEGRPLPPGSTGEIVCRSDVVMAGYWRNPKATEEALRDGWLHTGDVGSLDARGFLTLKDRSKDVIISGGSNIYPREVEEVLLTHHAVGEACVVGQPDAEWGEVVIAFVVPSDEAAVDAAVLDAHCLQHLARFKRPKAYRFVDALPKNSYGKVLKRVLRLQLEGPGPG